MTYSKRVTSMVGSKPTLASAPTPATTTARTHSRAARQKVRAGTVAVTASTAATTAVITAAPVCRKSSSVSTVTRPSAEGDGPEDHRAAAGAGRERPRVGGGHRDGARLPQPLRADRHGGGHQRPHPGEHQDETGQQRRPALRDPLVEPGPPHRAARRRRRRGRRPSPGRRAAPTRSRTDRDRRVGTDRSPRDGDRRDETRREGYRRYVRRLSRDGFVRRASSSRARDSSAVRTAGPSWASASTSPSGSTTSEWPV